MNSGNHTVTVPGTRTVKSASFTRVKTSGGSPPILSATLGLRHSAVRSAASLRFRRALRNCCSNRGGLRGVQLQCGALPYPQGRKFPGPVGSTIRHSAFPIPAQEFPLILHRETARRERDRLLRHRRAQQLRNLPDRLCNKCPPEAPCARSAEFALQVPRASWRRKRNPIPRSEI